MPPVSQSQRRWAYATAAGKTDAPISVGKEFLGHGIRNLPERASMTKEIGKRLLQKRGA